MSAIAQNRMKNWEVIADNLSKAGWSWGCNDVAPTEMILSKMADGHRAKLAHTHRPSRPPAPQPRSQIDLHGGSGLPRMQRGHV